MALLRGLGLLSGGLIFSVTLAGHQGLKLAERLEIELVAVAVSKWKERESA